MIKIGVNWWKNETAKGIYQLHHLKRETALTLLYTLYIHILLVPYNNDCKVSSAHTHHICITIAFLSTKSTVHIIDKENTEKKRKTKLLISYTHAIILYTYFW